MTSSYRYCLLVQRPPTLHAGTLLPIGHGVPSPPSPSTSREPGELSPQPRSPSPTAVRSTNRVTLCGSILGPWSARPKWAPTTASFLAVAQNQGKATLKMTLKLAFPPSSSPILSFLNLSRHPLSVVVVCRLVRSHSTPTLRVKHLRSKLTKP